MHRCDKRIVERSRMNYKKLKALALALSLCLVVATPASAATLQEQREARQAQVQATKEQIQATQEQRQVIREESLDQRCSLVTQRIDLWTTRYANNQSRFQKVEDQLVKITDQVIARAKNADKDTTALEAAVTEFRRLSDITSAEYQELIAALNNTKQYACGESEGAFKNALTAARSQMQVTRQASLNARSYYQKSVRPAAQALLNQ